MELTENQIVALYAFTKKHYVEYYDVQTELVDHLANDIEETIKEQPNLSFEQARDTAFKKFGVFGFMHVLEAKQKQLSKKYSMLIWGYIKMWFTIPKIIITLTIISFFYLLMSLNIKKEYLTIFMIALAIVDTLLTIKLSKKAKKRFQQKKKKYLLEEMIFKVGAFSNLFIFSNLLHLQFLFRSSNAVFFKLFVALLLTTAIIYSYVSLVLVPKKADELLNITYPEYKSASFL